MKTPQESNGKSRVGLEIDTAIHAEIVRLKVLQGITQDEAYQRILKSGLQANGLEAAAKAAAAETPPS